MEEIECKGVYDCFINLSAMNFNLNLLCVSYLCYHTVGAFYLE